MSSDVSTFDVFLSHSSADKPWVLTLKNALEKRGLTVWVDRDEIRPGDLFPDAIQDGLSKSRAMALVISPSALGSAWVREEYNRALAAMLSGSSALRLVPVLIKGAVSPEFVGPRQHVDFGGESDFG